MQPPDAILLDLDDTLLDGRGLDRALAGTCELVASDLENVEASRLFDANRRIWADYWPAVENDWTLGRIDGAAVTLEAWTRALADCGCRDEEVVELAVRTHSEQVRAAYRLHDDVPGFLEGVRPRFHLALVTNGASDTQRERLRWLDLDDIFDVVVISGEAGVAKPDAAVFNIALDHLAVSPRSAWHVGDSLRTDVAGARGAGLTAIWLNREGVERAANQPEPDIEVRSLTELLPIFVPPLR